MTAGLPAGFVLDEDDAGLPPGFELDDPSGPNFSDSQFGNDEIRGRSGIDTAKDIGLSLLSGAIEVPKGILGLADLAATPARAAYEYTTGNPSGTLTQGAANIGVDFERAQGILSDAKSDSSREQRTNVNQEFDKNGVLGGLGALYESPAVAFEALAESVPGMATLAGATKVFALRIYQQAAQTAVAGGASAEAAAVVGREAVTAAIPKLSAISSSLEGAQAAGSAAATDAADGDLSGREAGAAAGAGISTAVIGRLVNNLGAKIGLDDVDTLIATRGMRDAAGNIFSGAAKGTLKETLEEAPQSGSEQAWSNFGDRRPLGEGVAQAATEGGVVGGLMGLGGGGLGAIGNKGMPDIDRMAAEAGEAARAKGGDNLDVMIAQQQVYWSQPMPTAQDYSGGEPPTGPDAPINYNPYQETMRPLGESAYDITGGIGTLTPEEQFKFDQEYRAQQEALANPGGIPFESQTKEPEGLSLAPLDQPAGQSGQLPGNTIDFESPRPGVLDEKVGAIEKAMADFQRQKEDDSYRSLPPGREPLDPVRLDDLPPAKPALQDVHEAVVAGLEAQLREAAKRSGPGKANDNKGKSSLPMQDREILHAIASRGGLNQEEASLQGIDSSEFGRQEGGLARVFKKNGGIPFDQMAEELSQEGFFGDEPYSVNGLLDKINQSLSGNPVYSPKSSDAAGRQANQQEADRIQQAIAQYEQDAYEDQDTPPKGPTFNSGNDDEKRVGYAILEAELAGVDGYIVDYILNANLPDTEIEEALKGAVTNVKKLREGLRSPRQAEGDSRGNQAAPRGPGAAQESGRPAAVQPETPAREVAPTEGFSLTQETEAQRAERESKPQAEAPPVVPGPEIFTLSTGTGTAGEQLQPSTGAQNDLLGGGFTTRGEAQDIDAKASAPASSPLSDGILDAKFTDSSVTGAELFANIAERYTSAPKSSDASDIISVLEARVAALNTSFSEGLPESVFSNAKASGNSSSIEAFIKQIDGFLKIPRKFVNSPGVQSALDKASRDSAAADIKLFGDSGAANAIRSQGFDSLDIKTQSVVKDHMITVAKDLKVLRSIVELIPVNMVDVLGGEKFSASQILSDNSMLLDAFTSALNDPVVVGRLINHIATSHPIAFASPVAKAVFDLPESVGLPIDGVIAKRTLNEGQGNISDVKTDDSTDGADGDKKEQPKPEIQQLKESAKEKLAAAADKLARQKADQALSETMLKEEFEDEAGNTVVVEQSALDRVRQLNKRIEVCDKLLECLKT